MDTASLYQSPSLLPAAVPQAAGTWLSLSEPMSDQRTIIANLNAGQPDVEISDAQVREAGAVACPGPKEPPRNAPGGVAAARDRDERQVNRVAAGHDHGIIRRADGVSAIDRLGLEADAAPEERAVDVAAQEAGQRLREVRPSGLGFRV